MHRLTAPGNPHQNGVSERLNRKLLELVRTMLHHKELDKSFWAGALNFATHIRNRVTTRDLPATTTPYEMLFGSKPSIRYLRVFGCRCWYTAEKHSVGKLDARASEAIMIGYTRGSRGYKLWDISSRKVVVSRDVRFGEYFGSSAKSAIEDSAKNDDCGTDPSLTEHLDSDDSQDPSEPS